MKKAPCGALLEEFAVCAYIIIFCLRHRNRINDTNYMIIFENNYTLSAGDVIKKLDICFVNICHHPLCHIDDKRLTYIEIKVKKIYFE